MNKRVFSILGLFDDPKALMDAIPILQSRFSFPLEAYTPYPVHGIERALRRRKSPIAGMVLVMGVVGALAGIGFELWTSGIDYPLMTAGKPVWSWQAFVPIMFEVMVLFATFTAGLGMMFLLNRLPMFRHPMLRSRSMPLVTRDKFALAVEPGAEAVDVEEVKTLLHAAGASSVEVVDLPEPPGPISPNFILRAFTTIAISCLVAGYLTYWAIKLFPVTAPMVHMLDQPRLDPQREEPFFKDDFGMRLPVAGTVARGYLPYTIGKQEDAAVLGNPLPRTALLLQHGRQVYMNNCSPCHGILGNGQPTLTAAYGAKPANLIAQSIREYPDGKIYHVMVSGKNAMPTYAAELTQDERWSAIHYIRALQRSQNALDSDIPKEAK